MGEKKMPAGKGGQRDGQTRRETIWARIENGRLGRWVLKHGAPPWWAAPLASLLAMLISILSILISAGVFAR